MSFASDLAKFGDKAKAKQSLALRKTAFELFSRVIMRTPVDTGRLRGNWQATTARPASGVLKRVDSGPVTHNGSGSSKAKARVETVVLGDRVSNVFHLTNNLPYAAVIEYSGHSKIQAPAGMVRISVAEFEPIVEEITKGLRT